MGWFGGTLWRGVRSVVETETDSGATLVSEHDADGGDGYQVEAMVCSGTNIAFQSLHNSSSGTKWRCWLSLVSQHLRGVVRAGVDLLLKIWTHALGLHCDYRKWSLGKSKSSDLNLDWHHHCRNQSNMQRQSVMPIPFCLPDPIINNLQFKLQAYQTGPSSQQGLADQMNFNVSQMRQRFP